MAPSDLAAAMSVVADDGGHRAKKCMLRVDKTNNSRNQACAACAPPYSDIHLLSEALPCASFPAFWSRQCPGLMGFSSGGEMALSRFVPKAPRAWPPWR